MKTRTLLFAMAILLCAALPAHAGEHGYTFGVLWNAGARLNTSYSMMTKDITKAISISQGVQFSNLLYSNVEKFHEDIAMRKLDFIYANTEDDFLMGIMYGYKPFASFSLFGKEKASQCVYVRNDSGIDDLKALKGKTLVTYPHQLAYTQLRKILNAPPEKHFASMVTSTDAFAMVDALVSGKMDAMFLVETNIDFFKQVNPGPVKQIKKIACSDPMHFMPIMVAPEVPEDLLARFEEFYASMNKNETLKKYRPFFKQVDLKVFRVSDKEYEPFFLLYEFALAQKWDKAHDAWLATSMPLQ